MSLDWIELSLLGLSFLFGVQSLPEVARGGTEESLGTMLRFSQTPRPASQGIPGRGAGRREEEGSVPGSRLFLQHTNSHSVVSVLSGPSVPQGIGEGVGNPARVTPFPPPLRLP